MRDLKVQAHDGIDLAVRDFGGGGPSTADDWVSDIEAVIDRVALADAFVVGDSLGGANAMLYGLAHPECPLEIAARIASFVA